MNVYHYLSLNNIHSLVALTYLDDDENARQAYEQAVSLEARDPSVCLNYAIFLQNQNDKVRVSVFSHKLFMHCLSLYYVYESGAV